MSPLRHVSGGLIWAFIFTFCLKSIGYAQSGLEVTQNVANLEFPLSITFTLQASTANEISQVYLEYGTNSQTCVDGVARQEAELKNGKTFTASWKWDFKDSGSLPPGAEVWWLWEVKFTSGEIIRTAQKTLIIEDQRLNWKVVQDDNIQVVWSEGSHTFGRQILNLAVASLKKLEEEAGIHPTRIVRMTIYPTSESLLEAGLFFPEWTGGLAFPEYSVLMMAIPVDSGEWMNEVIPHELAHLITGELVFNCLGIQMPTWLSEGLSVYAEATENEQDSERVRKALENGTLPPLRNLVGGFPSDAQKTELAYSQSGEIVRFLLKNYDSEKMSDLLATLQSGLLINPALQQVYGFDTDGLDNIWRTSLGFFSAENQSTPATATPFRTSVPTRALWTPIVRPSLVPSATIPVFGTVTPTSTKIAIALNASPTLCPNNLPCDQESSAPSSKLEIEPEKTKTLAIPSESKPAPLPCISGSIPISGIFLMVLLLALRPKTRGPSKTE